MLKGQTKHEDKELGKSRHEAPRSVNHKATRNKNNTETNALEVLYYRIIHVFFFFFHALTVTGSRGSFLNTRPQGRVFKLLSGDPAKVNVLKQTCVIVILAFYIIP